MARRNRRATRPVRRDAAPERRAVTTETSRQPARDTARARARSRLAHVDGARATGEPSAALERAAALERGHVVKDSRRLAITIAVMLALLVASGFAVNAIFP